MILAHLGITMSVKVATESKWQALAQTGVHVQPYQRSGGYYEIILYHSTTGDEFYFKTYQGTSMRWEKSFYVQMATNKKEAVLAAKMYVLDRIEVLKVSGQLTEIRVTDIVGVR